VLINHFEIVMHRGYLMM